MLFLPMLSSQINFTLWHNSKILDQDFDQLENNLWLDDDFMGLKFSFPNLYIEPVYSYPGKVFHQISLEGGGNLAEVGNPRLPFKTIQILLPYGKDLKDIKVISGKEVELEGKYEIEPAQEQVPIGLDKTPELNLNEEVYNSELNFPKKIYNIEGIHEFRGYRILIVNLFPISYIPKLGKITHIKDMVINIELVNSKDVNKYYRDSTKDKTQILQLVDNPEVINSYTQEKTQIPSFDLQSGSYDYLIITSNSLLNSMGTFTFQDLASSKNASGLQTRIVTTEYIYANYPGIDQQEQIRNFIIDAYQTWGIEYVLLGGDGDAVSIGGESGDAIIPARGLYATAYGLGLNISSDLYYAGLDGNWNTDGDNIWGEEGEDDLYAEVYIGRAPVDSEDELSNFIHKTLIHEQEKHPYLSKALMIGEDLGWSVWGGDYKDEVKDGSDSWGYTTMGFPVIYIVDTLYDRDLDPDSWDKNDLISLINDNIHIINHLGHCDVEYAMKMVNHDADSLTNNHYFFGYSQGCYNGAFDNIGAYGSIHMNDSIAEHFVTSPNGAFAFIANSRFGWGDVDGTDGASQYYDRQFFDAIFGEGIEEIGKANQDSKHDNVGYISQEAMRWCYYQLNLFGDPSAKLPPQPNDYAPSLVNGDITPSTGNQTTLFNYTVDYYDQDGNPPLRIDVVINGENYPMFKVNPLDENYTDGCGYYFTTFLQPGSYDYYFECEDYKFKYSTSTYFGPTVSENPNENSPTLTIGQVHPDNGLCNQTSFSYTINYTDLDNNAPEYVTVTINSTSFSMAKQDPIDSNYMDGCLYLFETTLENIGLYEYYFNCSDGTNLASDGIYLGPKIMITPLFEGMFIKHILNLTGTIYDSEFSYEYDSGSLFNVKWNISSYIGTWKVNALNRIMSEASGALHFGNGYHTPAWIFTNASLGDNVLIAVDGEGDHIFNVTNELKYVLPDFGKIGIWVLEDLTTPGGIAWYEKSTGVLLNASFLYSGGSYELSFEFVDSNSNFAYCSNLDIPDLTNHLISSLTGDQTTLFTFNVTYADLDNDFPIFINLVINDSKYSMKKIHSYDNYYIDGCDYTYDLYLQPGTYEYYFECSDWSFYNSTELFIGLNVSEIVNENPPLLTDGKIIPNYGYTNTTLFTYWINYTDLDNNSPLLMTVTINSTIYSMYRQNPYDNNYMDGCIYIYEHMFEEEGTYQYYFNCSDGSIQDNYGPLSGPLVKSCQLFEGLYIKHRYEESGSNYDSDFSYSYHSGDLFETTWEIYLYTNTWKENVTTRIMTETSGMIHFGNGYHSPVWIYNDISLGENVLIAVDSEGDHIFNVTGDIIYTIPQVGNVEAWILEDLTVPGGIALYEKSTGVLINSTFFYNGGSNSYSFKYIESNAKFKFIELFNEPELIYGAVTPIEGTEYTEFTFSVNYIDLDNEEPQYIDVVINGTGYSMVKSNPGDNNYVDGCIYYYSTHLNPSAYNYFYYFICSDGSFDVSTSVYNDLKVNALQSPNSFTLNTDALSPDTDGIFNLNWTASSGANNYTLYEYDSLITKINNSLSALTGEISDLSLPLSGYSNGIYYFVVVAHNKAGDTISNCIQVIVGIPSTRGIPGYTIFFLLFVALSISVIILKKWKTTQILK